MDHSAPDPQRSRKEYNDILPQNVSFARVTRYSSPPFRGSGDLAKRQRSLHQPMPDATHMPGLSPYGPLALCLSSRIARTARHAPPDTYDSRIKSIDPDSRDMTEFAALYSPCYRWQGSTIQVFNA